MPGATAHAGYSEVLAAVSASRSAKAKGDAAAERRLLRRAQRLTERIIADVAREPLP